MFARLYTFGSSGTPTITFERWSVVWQQLCAVRSYSLPQKPTFLMDACS